MSATAGTGRQRVRAALCGEPPAARITVPIVNGFTPEVLGREIDPANATDLVNGALRSHQLFGGDGLIVDWRLNWLDEDGFEARQAALATTIAGVRDQRPAVGVGVALGGLASALAGVRTGGGDPDAAVDRAVAAIAEVGAAQPDLIIFADSAFDEQPSAADWDEIWSILSHFEVGSLYMWHPTLGSDVPSPGRDRRPNGVVLSAAAAPAWTTDVHVRATAIPAPGTGVRSDARNSLMVTDWCWGPPASIADARAALES